jgi:hypothetical protein
MQNPYGDPISFLQLRLVRDYRAQPNQDAKLRDAIRLSINGIEARLRVTGRAALCRLHTVIIAAPNALVCNHRSYVSAVSVGTIPPC